MCSFIFGRKGTDKRYMWYSIIFFFINLYISCLVRRYNDIQSIECQNYSIMNNYIKLIKKSKNFYQFHVYVIDYNYLYVPIFLITMLAAILAKLAESKIENFAARAAENNAITVSPAPVTSNTSAVLVLI